jgi:hypothetical protein
MRQLKLTVTSNQSTEIVLPFFNCFIAIISKSDFDQCVHGQESKQLLPFVWPTVLIFPSRIDKLFFSVEI